MSRKINKEDLKELSKNELQDRLKTDKEKLLKTKFAHTVSPIENTNNISEIRRDIARYKTELRAREIAEQRA